MTWAILSAAALLVTTLMAVSAASAQAQSDTPSSDPPTLAPTIYRLIDLQKPNRKAFTVGWSKIDDPSVTGHEIQTRPSGGSWKPARWLGPKVQFFAYQILTPRNADHEFRVRALNENGPGPWSAVASTAKPPTFTPGSSLEVERTTPEPPEGENTGQQRGSIYVEILKDNTVYGNSNGLTSTFNVAEGSSGMHMVPIQVRLTGSPSAAVNVRLKFHKPNDTEVQGRKRAGPNRDFHFMYKTLTWAANASGDDLTKTINLQIVGDTREENDETVKLVVKEIDGTPLSSDSNVKISRNGRQQIIKVVIDDDDGG